ncbi:hypothetical protein Tco_0090345 [Tanacetum coccineum]
MLVTIHITKHTLVVVAGDGGDGVEVAVVAAVVWCGAAATRNDCGDGGAAEPHRGVVGMVQEMGGRGDGSQES